MALLDSQVSSQVKDLFQGLKDPVVLEWYRGPDANTAKTFEDLMNEVADLSDLIMVQEGSEEPLLEPGHPGNETATGPIGELLDKDGHHTGIRFVGIPSGHEFGALLEAIKAVSTHTSGLSAAAEASLATLQKPVHIQVFTTPT